MRVAGRLVDLPGSSPVTPEDAEAVRERVITRRPAKQAELDENGSADASYAAGDHRFRATAFSQRGFPSFVFRAVSDAPDAGSARAAGRRGRLGARSSAGSWW